MEEFEPIFIDRLDFDQLKQIDEDDVFTVPYILSAEPPIGWQLVFKECISEGFQRYPRPDLIALTVDFKPFDIKIYKKQITFKWRLSEENARKIKRNGPFWTFVAGCVNEANKQYLKLKDMREGEKLVDARKEEQRAKNFAEAKRLLQMNLNKK